MDQLELLITSGWEWKVPLEKCDLESGGDGAAAGVWRGVRGGVLEKPGVESPLERSLLQTCTPGFGNGEEGEMYGNSRRQKTVPYCSSFKLSDLNQFM